MRFYRIEADVTGMEETVDRRRRQEQGCMFQAKTEAAYSASADMVMPFVSFLRDGHIVCGMLTKRRMLELVRPATFDELIRVHGLASAHEPWRGGAIKLLREGASISRLLCFRDELGPGDVDINGEVPYLFPKAHIVGIDSMGFRLAWYKLHTPLAFYRETFRYLLENGRFDTDREAQELVHEFRLRGYDLGQIDLMTTKSDH